MTDLGFVVLEQRSEAVAVLKEVVLYPCTVGTAAVWLKVVLPFLSALQAMQLQ